MELLRRTINPAALPATGPKDMATTTNPISDITSATVEAATRFTKAAKHVTSITDATVRASGNGKSKK